MAEADGPPGAGQDRLTVDLLVNSLNPAFSNYHSRPSGHHDLRYCDVGVQADLPSPPRTHLRLTTSRNLIDFSPSPPRTPPLGQATPALTSTPPSRAATPTPSSYLLRTPTKRSAYTQLARRRPRSNALVTRTDGDVFHADVVEELHLRSFAGIPPSKLHIPRPLESMEEDQDVFAAQAVDLALALGRRVVSTPSTSDGAIPISITRPRAASDSLAALAYAAVIQEADLLARLQEFESTDSLSGVPLSHCRSASSGFSDSTLSTSSLTSLDTDEELATIRRPRIRRNSHEFTLTDSIMNDDCPVPDAADVTDKSESSPPKSIPALHGPLSLPYARCPSWVSSCVFVTMLIALCSGAEGIIIEEPENLHRIIWGLEHERRHSEPAPAPSADTTLSAAPQHPLQLSHTIIQEEVQAMPRFCGVVSSYGLAQRRAADLAPRRRIHSTPAAHEPTTSTNSTPTQSSLRPNAPSFQPGLPQMRRVTIDPAVLYVSPSMPLQSPIMLASDEPDTYASNGPQWHPLYDLPAVPVYQSLSPGYDDSTSFLSGIPLFQGLSNWNAPCSAENLNLLQRLTMCSSNVHGFSDPRAALGNGQPSFLPARFGDTNPLVARRVTYATPRSPANTSRRPLSTPGAHPVSRLDVVSDIAMQDVPENIEIITIPATPITPVAPYAPANIDRNLLQANDVARAAARAGGVSETRLSTPTPCKAHPSPMDWPSSFKQFWQEQQASRAQDSLTADLSESPTRKHDQGDYRRPMAPRPPGKPRSVPMLRLVNRRTAPASLPTLPETDEDALGTSPKRVPPGLSRSLSSKTPSWQRPQGSSRTPSPSGLGRLAPQTKTDAEDPDKVDGWVVRLPQPTITVKPSALSASSPDDDVVVFQGTRRPTKGKGKGRA
ncbi:hypothetical protein CALVIDRAFT_540390 [Calocera viscosa TUFC12733]|uniref:Uncharacterized protein n=1 Tax=Calocera viscosa (strain TUFC12733) TaxID=1330018 RepID=A0A167J1K0_CALVF|nr:hypothetical protein CALVIDRAFT_540390 [Calocera viscosa TUFC12733]